MHVTLPPLSSGPAVRSWHSEHATAWLRVRANSLSGCSSPSPAGWHSRQKFGAAGWYVYGLPANRVTPTWLAVSAAVSGWQPRQLVLAPSFDGAVLSRS